MEKASLPVQTLSFPLPDGGTLTLTADEVKWIRFYSDGEPTHRCGCGHNYQFHNGHCCVFCMVDGCDCAG